MFGRAKTDERKRPVRSNKMKGYLEQADKEERRKSVERCLAILSTATNGPDELFMNALDSYIEGEISLSELEKKVDRLEYIEKSKSAETKEEYQIPEIEIQSFKNEHK